MVHNVSPDLIQRARLLRIRLQRVIRGTKWGEHKVARVTSSGIEFDALREYQQGDDIRTIDWKSSARTARIIVRSYRESHNRAIIIVLDATASMACGSGAHLKEDVARDLAVMIAYAAEYAGDSIGIVAAQGDTITLIPPRSGKGHITMLVQKILSQQSLGQRVDWHSVGRSVASCGLKNALVVVLSDGIGAYFMEFLQEIARRHVVVFGCIQDELETHVPFKIGIITRDPETNRQVSMITQAQRQSLQDYLRAWHAKQAKSARLCRIHYVNLVSQGTYESALLQILHRGVI